MNRFRYLAIGVLVMVTLAASAKQNAVGSDKQEHVQNGAQNSEPNVDQHLKMLSERLNLTSDQQTRVKPILQQFLEGRQKLIENQSLTDDQRRERISALHAKADKQVRPILSDEQKKQLDELEQEHHH